MAKDVIFRGSALDDLRSFPASARRKAGYQLDHVQNGREPDNWKPMNSVGRGVQEIRIRDATGAFRIIYAASPPMPFMCCIASRKRRRKPVGPISTSPSDDIANCCGN